VVEQGTHKPADLTAAVSRVASDRECAQLWALSAATQEHITAIERIPESGCGRPRSIQSRAVGSVVILTRAVGALPGGELRPVEGAGHTPWLDDPGLVGGHVRQFLKG
jgi:pimeloyl-ACP methyl ester carboxylesterase